jgi:hypothetical protein
LPKLAAVTQKLIDSADAGIGFVLPPPIAAAERDVGLDGGAFVQSRQVLALRVFEAFACVPSVPPFRHMWSLNPVVEQQKVGLAQWTESDREVGGWHGEVEIVRSNVSE